MRTWRTAAVIITLVMGIAACSSDDGDDATETSAGVTRDSLPTTNVETTDVVDTTDASDTTAGDTTPTSGTTGGTDTTTDDTLEVEARIDQAREALEAGNFSAMLQALSLSGLADEINDREVTILAPTDDAFAELSRDEVSDLLTNPSQVDDVLRRHILDELYTLDELTNQTEVTTLTGDTLEVSNANGQLIIDGAVVSEPANSRFDGTAGQELALFSIDRVLLEGS